MVELRLLTTDVVGAEAGRLIKLDEVLLVLNLESTNCLQYLYIKIAKISTNQFPAYTRVSSKARKRFTEYNRCRGTFNKIK